MPPRTYFKEIALDMFFNSTFNFSKFKKMPIVKRERKAFAPLKIPRNSESSAGIFGKERFRIIAVSIASKGGKVETFFRMFFTLNSSVEKSIAMAYPNVYIIRPFPMSKMDM